MKHTKIIRTETISDSISYPLVRVTFENENGTIFYGDMSPDELKVRKFEEKMRHKLTAKEMEELDECFSIKYREGGDSEAENHYCEGEC